MRTLNNGLMMLALGLAVTGVGVAQKPSIDHVTGRLLVQTVLGPNDSAAAQAIAQSGAKLLHRIDSINVQVLSVPEPALDAIAQVLQRSGRFTFVERDFLAHPAGSVTPNDPDFSSQWHLATIQAPSAWGVTLGSANIPIAVIDSGADSTHPDLGPKLIAGWNFLTGNSNTAETGCSGGHGTAVAGAAAAATNNGTGVAGVAWANTIMPLVVLDSSCNASYSDTANAITYAADHGVRIINISLGGTSDSSTLDNAVSYAWNKGAVVFAAAGNSSNSTPMYPAASPFALAISATEPTGTLASFSNYGSYIDLAAPGDNILSTEQGGGYWYCWGTSLATPVAAGVGALALSANPSLTATQLVNILEQNADALGGMTGWNQYFGWGQVDAYKAVMGAIANTPPPDTTPPTVSISSPSSGASVAGTVAVQGTATDNVSVSNIQFYVDGVLSTSTTTSPFSFSWNTLTGSNGSHTITIKAYDPSGNVGQASVTVTANNAAPIVTITSPANGATVSGTVQVQGTAVTSASISKITFSVNGTLIATTASSPFSFSWNTTSQTSGTDTLSVTAYDTIGYVTTLAIMVNVNNSVQQPPPPSSTTPPTVTITSPANGATVSRTTNISVSVTDSVSVTRVSIYIDNVQLCSDTAAPYTCSWNTKKYTAGSHTISATAWDSAGNVGYANPITVKK